MSSIFLRSRTAIGTGIFRFPSQLTMFNVGKVAYNIFFTQSFKLIKQSTKADAMSSVVLLKSVCNTKWKSSLKNWGYSSLADGGKLATIFSINSFFKPNPKSRNPENQYNYPKIIKLWNGY